MNQDLGAKAGSVLAGMLVLLLMAGPSTAQISRALNVGNIWYFTNEAHSQEDITFPRDWVAARTIYGGNLTHNSLDMLHMGRVSIGINMNWIDEAGAQWNKMIAEAGEIKGFDLTRMLVPAGFVRMYRFPYPRTIVDRTDWTTFEAEEDQINPDLPAEVVIYMKNQAWPAYGGDMAMERWAYAFANRDYGDFVLLEYVFTNTSQENREDVYFAFTSSTNSHSQYPADYWGNYYGVTHWDYVAGNPDADSLRIWYSWDADDPAVQGVDTRGDPDPVWGNFREPHSMSFVVVHADRSASDESDNPHQPVKVGWSQREFNPSIDISDHHVVYDFITQPWDLGVSEAYSIFVDSTGAEVPQGMYRILKPDFDQDDFSVNLEQEKSVLFSFGPYQMAASEDVRIVLAYAGGTISLRTAIDAGAAYDNGSPSRRPVTSLPDPILDLDGNVLFPAGTILDKEQKNAVLDLSIAAAFRTAGKAIRVWENGNVTKGVGSFNIPMAPPSPTLNATSKPDTIRLEWGNEAETSPNAGTITGYKIYRNYQRRTVSEMPTDTSFVLHAEVPAGTFEFIDTDVIRGDAYYYYVTAVNSDGIESSPWLNRTGTIEDRVQQALIPTRAPDPDWTDKVVVVPNPFHAAAANRLDDDISGRRLNFLNLPAFANIRIYTQTGDLVQIIEHDSQTGDDTWVKQDTFNTTEIVSGLYIYVIQELDGPRGSPTGKKAIGKFVVIK